MDKDIIIVGGGLNGCTLALALDQVGFDVTLVESVAPSVHSRNDFDGRSYAVAAANQRMLNVLGLWDDLRDGAGPILDIKVTQGRAGEGPSPNFLHFDHNDLGSGPMGYMVEDRHLRAVLLDHIAQSGVTHLVEKTVIAQEASAAGISVTLDDGQELSAKMLVGADGRASGTALRTGIQRVSKDYDQASLVCALEHDLPHNGVAHQFFVPSGPLAILPLAGNRCSIVWTETKANAATIQAMSDEDYLSILRLRIGDFLGDIRLTGDRYTYPLGLIVSHTLVADRVALIGDAARGIHPIAGQGLNAGLKDVAALAEILTDTRRVGMDIGNGNALADYQRWRRFDSAALALATDGFNAIYSNDNPLLRGLRSVGMGMVNALPQLRNGFMKEAAGLTGDLPRLLQGRVL